MFGWYRELLEIRRENNRENELIETLKHEIEMLRHERDTLLNHALHSNQQEVAPPVVEQEFKPIPANRLPWAARRQMLEAEDRAQAKLKRQQQEVVQTLKADVDDLEKELNIVEKERSS
jgi:hypothetical protein